MTFSYKLDLSRYTDNEVALMFVEGVITREELEQWRADKTKPVESSYTLTKIASKPSRLPKAFGSRSE